MLTQYRPLPEGTFFGGDVEPGTFHCAERVDDRDNVNAPLDGVSDPPIAA